MAPVKGAIFFVLIIPMTMALNDHHSVVAPMIAAMPSAMEATVMLAISKLGARATKTTLPIHIPIAADPNAKLLRTCNGRRRYRNCSERGKRISEFFHVFLL